MKIAFSAAGLVLCAVTAQAADVAPKSTGAAGFKVATRIAGPDDRWDLVSIDADARRLYVAHGAAVTAVNLDTGVLTPVLIKTAHAHGVIPLHGTTRAAVANADTDTLTIFEGDSGKIVGEVKTGRNPDALVQDPATGLVYVMNHTGGDITIVDPTALKAEGTIPVGGALELAVLDGKGHLYVNVEDKNEVVAVDLAARKVAKRIPLKGCEGPTGIAYEPKNDLVVSACDDWAMVVSGSAGKKVAQVPIGAGADTVIFDAAHNQFLVPNGESATMTVIAADAKGALKVIDTVATQENARTAALDPKTGRVYLPAAKVVPSPDGKGKTPVPGTFNIMVLER